MSHFEVYDERTIIRDINGMPVTFEVEIAVAEDYGADPEGDFDFGDAQENAEYLARFESGELFMGLIQVTATALGVQGTDLMCSCHLPAVRGDGGKELAAEVIAMADDHDMVNIAIEECIQLIQDTAERLKGFAKAGAGDET